MGDPDFAYLFKSSRPQTIHEYLKLCDERDKYNRMWEEEVRLANDSHGQRPFVGAIPDF